MNLIKVQHHSEGFLESFLIYTLWLAGMTEVWFSLVKSSKAAQGETYGMLHSQGSDCEKMFESENTWKYIRVIYNISYIVWTWVYHVLNTLRYTIYHFRMLPRRSICMERKWRVYPYPCRCKLFLIKNVIYPCHNFKFWKAIHFLNQKGIRIQMPLGNPSLDVSQLQNQVKHR